MIKKYLPTVVWISSYKLKLKALEQLDIYYQEDLFFCITNID